MDKWIYLFCFICLAASPLAQLTEKEESAKANAFFERCFQQEVNDSPMFQGYLGIKKDYGKWDDLSDKKAQRDLEFTKKNLKWLKENIHYKTLDEQTKISFDLFVQRSTQKIENFKYRFHNYPVNQMFGWQSRVPSFLISIHRIQNLKDAQAYISRLQEVSILFGQLTANLKIREQKNIIAPKFVYPYVISDCKNILKGNPFTKSDRDSALLADFKRKLEKLNLDAKLKKSLIKEAIKALMTSVLPSYQKFIMYIAELEKKASTEDGVWKFPDGNAFYNAQLKKTTTTNLTAEQIHQIGLKEVARIHGEMRKIKEKVNFKGDLQKFFGHLRSDKKFYYSNSKEGRAAYLQKARDYINAMQKRLDELFITKPKTKLVVKAVEAFREKSAGKAFYQSASADGSRPGAFYANLYKMEEMPVYQLEALAYHEGIPGHHMQLSIAQNLKNIPKFRKYGGYTAYGEGWGLYTEYLPKEIGFYQDPYSDFGRLAMELWRACRLVVDTGIHLKKWTREQGIAYYKNNTPNPLGDCIKMVERHIVMASQATAYKIGMIKILEFREIAKKKLGKKFDIREFHEVVLTNGSVPLNVLAKNIDRWIASK